MQIFFPKRNLYKTKIFNIYFKRNKTPYAFIIGLYFNLFSQTACFNSTTIYIKSQNILYSTYLDVAVLKLRELSPVLVGSEDTLKIINLYAVVKSRDIPICKLLAKCREIISFVDFLSLVFREICDLISSHEY